MPISRVFESRPRAHGIANTLENRVSPHKEIAQSAVLEQFPVDHALVLLAESAELKRIVPFAGADLIDDEVVVGNRVTFFGMVP